MTTVVRIRAITDTPLANKRVALTAFTSHPVYRRFYKLVQVCKPRLCL